MRRAIVGNVVGVRHVMLLVLALVAFLGAGPALAQDYVFKTIDIDYYRFGVSTNKTTGADRVIGTDDDTILYASGILCASDEDKDIFPKDKTKDNKWDYSPDGRLDTQWGYVRLLKKTMDRPIIANIERNEQLYLATIIEGVPRADVTALRAGSKDPAQNAVMASLISMVTADFSPGLFAYHTNKSVYSGIHPTFATSTFDIKRVLDGDLPTDNGRTEEQKTDSKQVSKLINFATSVIVYWDISGLKVSATDAIATQQSFSATMAINGGGTTEEQQKRQVGKTNFVGIETGKNSAPAFLSNWKVLLNPNDPGSTQFRSSEWGADELPLPDLTQRVLLDNNTETGNFPGVTLGMQINSMKDTTTNGLYGTPSDITKDPRVYLGNQTIGTKNANIPFQFRTKDKMNVKLEIIDREEFDGEPAEYFGAAASDKLEFTAASGKSGEGVGQGTFVGGKLVVSGWKIIDGLSVFSTETGDTTFSAASNDSQNEQQLIDVTMTVANSVITSSSFQSFQVKAAIQDEVQTATEVFTNHAIDTAAPFYTLARASAERPDGKLLPNGDVGKADADRDEAVFGIEIHGNGENMIDANVKKWLSLSFRDTARTAAQVKTPAVASLNRFSDFDDNPANAADFSFISYLDSSIVNNTHPTVKVSQVKGTLITNIPSTSTVIGASVVIRVRNNFSSTLNSGGLLVRAMDDARNPAVVYAGTSLDAVNNPAMATLDTTRKLYSISSFTPLTSNTLKSATVEIDNINPEITAAQVSVLGLPSGYFTGSTKPADAFAKLVTSKEQVQNILYTGAGADQWRVIRGAPASSLQGGSPMRLVVKIKPVANLDLAGEDTDGRPWTATNAAGNVAEFNRRFAFNISNPDLNYLTDGRATNYKAGDGDKKQRWIVEDATITFSTHSAGGKAVWDGAYANSVVYATFVDASGIPGCNIPGGISPAYLTVQAGDSILNLENPTPRGPFIVDNTKPVIEGSGNTYSYDTDGNPGNGLEGVDRVHDAHAKPTNIGTTQNPVWQWSGIGGAETGIYMTTYSDGTTDEVAIPSSEWNKDLWNFTRTLKNVNGVNQTQCFINSERVMGASWAGVKAGDSIIITGKFYEPDVDGVGGADAAFTQVGTAKSGFPFIMSTITASDPQIGADTPADWNIDVAGSLYGRVFKTISADFSDFIDEDSAKDVLPDVTSVAVSPSDGTVLPNTNIVAPGRMINAKWFFYVDGNRSLNLKPAGFVRHVTLTARDLSGNVTRKGIKAGTAAFSQPSVAILDFEIDNPLRGIRRAVVQRDSSYLGGAGVSAISLSQATVSVRTNKDDKIKSATVMVVAKIGDGLQKGGPFVQSGFLKLDLSSLNGPADLAPMKITKADGTPVVDGRAVAPTDILYATWQSDRFNADPAKTSANGKADKKIRVLAVASTGGVGAAESVAVQADQKIPQIITGAILERRALDSQPTQPFGDQAGDGIVRPNQLVSFQGRFTMDAYDKKYQSSSKFGVDLKQFGNPSVNIYTWVGYEDGFNPQNYTYNVALAHTKTAENLTVRGATYEFVIPTTLTSGFPVAIAYATDAAGNFKSSGATTPQTTVNSSRPEIQSIVLSASNLINYATDNFGVTLGWRDVGTRLATDPGAIKDKETKHDGSKPGFSIVKAKDYVRVVAMIGINDDVFTDLDVSADFSQLSGDAYKKVIPAPYTFKMQDHDARLQQATKVAGNIYWATWVHIIQPANTNITNASIRIDVINPSKVSAPDTQMRYSAPITVDNKAPIVTTKVAYYKKGKALGDVSEINPATELYQKGTKKNVGYATAAIIVSATYTDTDTYHGNAVSLFHALLYQGGYPGSRTVTSMADTSVVDKVFKIDTSGSTKINPKAAHYALSRESGVWNAHGSSVDGPVISSASAFGVDLSDTMIRRSTATVINIWYGQHPDSKQPNKGKYDPTGNDYALTFKEADFGKTGVKLLTNVYDNVGNKGAPGFTGVEIDGLKPYIQVGKKKQGNGSDAAYATIKGATLDVAPGEPLFLENGLANYVPAEFTPAGVLSRPTRVTQGTKVRLITYLFDDPDKTDPIKFALSGHEFGSKSSSFEFVSPAAEALDVQSISGRDKPFHTDKLWIANIDPTKVTDNVVEFVVDMPVGAEKSKPGNTTLPYKLTGANKKPNEMDDVLWANYNAQLDIIKNPEIGKKASPILDATDTVGNWRKDIHAGMGLEVDTEGPGVLEQFTAFFQTKADVDNLYVSPSKWPSGVNAHLPSGINANAGAWLVWGATLVIDGTNDLDFPLNKFDINWAETFEFDVVRLDHTKNYKGKKYLVSSATRSIVFVTNTIKINDNADPRNAAGISYHLEDIFGNVRAAEVPNSEWLAIGARGPVATEISLKVDGKVERIVGAPGMGIGNKGPDSASAKFEVYAGAKVIVEATITTIEGEAPDTILMDASDFYPVGLRPMVDELIPSATKLTSNGTIYAKWETIAYDVEGIVPRVATNIDNQKEWQGKRMAVFFDQSNLNWLGYGKEYTPRTGVPGAGGQVYNGPIFGATPVSVFNKNSVVYGDAKVGGTAPSKNIAGTKGGPLGTHNNRGSDIGSIANAMKALQGLPNLQVQKDAAAKRVASVTIYVADSDSRFPFEEALSTLFTVDTEPPRASYVYSVTQNLKVRERFTSGPRIGFPTAPNANRSDYKDPAPRVRQKDSVAVIVSITNSLIDKTGNDAFRTLPGMLPSDLSTGFFRINAADSASIKDVTVDLSGFSSIAGAANMSVFDPNAPVANPSFPNIVTITSQGEKKPDLIKATFSIKVTADRGTDVLSSNDPVEVTPTVVDDAGNRPIDNPYDKGIMLDNLDYVTGADNNWAKLHPQSILAVDNKGPFISGDVAAQIISGTAYVDNPLTGGKETLLSGALLEDEAIIAAGTVLRVTVTVTDQVDHPLDLIIKKNNYGNMALKAEGLKLSQSVLDAGMAKLSGPDSISVPFQITVPPAATGKSTFSFQFIIQATDTVGNMTEIRSVERFGFDANPDVEYYDSQGALITTGTVSINASAEAQLVASAKALDVGGIKTIEWIAGPVEGVTIISKDVDGNVVADNKLEAGSVQRAQLDLFAIVPIDSIVTPFTANAVVTDIDNNVNEVNVINVNINQPPIIAASLPYSATDDTIVNMTGDLLETIGLGYNAAFADIREVTIDEGTTISVKLTAIDANTADAVAISATGTAITSPAIMEGVAVGEGTGELDFTFKPGYLAVTGPAESATFALDVKAGDGSTMAPDTTRLVFNVLAKSATPLVSIESIKIDNKVMSDSVIKLNEGSTIQIVYKGQDPGNETLDVDLAPVPESVPATTEVAVTPAGIVYGTFTFTAGLQDADVPELSYDSLVDPLFANFTVANASFSNSALVPIDIINVSQAPIISATATVGGGQSVAVKDGGKITVKAGDVVNIEYRASDPDGNSILTTVAPPTVTPDTYVSQYVTLGYSGPVFTTLLTVTVPADVTGDNGSATIVYKTSDNTLQERTLTLTLTTESGPQPPAPADIDNVLLAQGWGGKNGVTWKNIDANVTEIDGRSVAVTSTYRSVAVASGPFLAGITGGADREAYMGLGDLDGDGDLDIALSMGHITTDAIFPNIVVVKDAKTKQLVGNSFVAFQTGTEAVNYNNGDTPIAVGNFIGSTTADQIATAQGFGGNNLIRIYQYTGLAKPNGFMVKAQFNGLAGGALTNNANGGVTMSAGDLTGDGRDELIVCQTNSATSRTQFTVIGFNTNGSVAFRMPGVAFKRNFQGNGGVNSAVVDLDGDGKTELVFASTGNTKNFGDGRDNVPLNVISILVPTVESGKVTGFTTPARNVLQIFGDAASPAGAQSIAGVEGNGLADGTELILGTKPVLSIDGMTITAVVKPDMAKYTFVKVDFDSAANAVNGISQFLGITTNGFNAFPPDLNPLGGGVNVAAGQTD